ncbi:MAG: hypothetical protein ACFB4I_11990 [Cyanophyceae cyanobacterium]
MRDQQLQPTNAAARLLKILLKAHVIGNSFANDSAMSIFARAMEKELKINVESLISNVNQSQLEPSLQFLLRKRLTDIRNAIENYQFYGVAAIEQEVEASLGALALNKDKFEKERHQPLVISFFRLIKDLLDIVSNTKQLFSKKVIVSIRNLLPGSII